MNLNKIGLLIGTLALILAVPLAIVANLLTPTVRDWYITTNQKRLRKRLDLLTKRLDQSEHQWAFSAAEWKTQRTIIGLVLILVLAVHTFWSLALIILLNYSKVLPADRHYFIHIIVLMGYVGNLLLVVKFMHKDNENRIMHSVVGREELRTEIKKLEANKRSQY
jgi:hypothetical protein